MSEPYYPWFVLESPADKRCADFHERRHFRNRQQWFGKRRIYNLAFHVTV